MEINYSSPSNKKQNPISDSGLGNISDNKWLDKDITDVNVTMNNIEKSE